MFDYDGLRREQAERRERQDPVQLGIGVSTFTEMCGLAPSRVLGCSPTGGWEHAAIRVLPTGKVEVVTGSSAHGQGHETAWSQIVADRLGVPFEDVEVLHGDTQISPRGMDTYGSRSLAVGGIAVVKAAEKVIAKARPIAAHMMECAENDLEYTEGRLRVKGTEKAVGIADVAPRCSPRTTCPTVSNRASIRRPPTTRTTSRSRTARICARRRSTPKPGRCGFALTYASTTSGT